MDDDTLLEDVVLSVELHYGRLKHAGLLVALLYKNISDWRKEVITFEGLQVSVDNLASVLLGGAVHEVAHHLLSVDVLEGSRRSGEQRALDLLDSVELWLDLLGFKWL
jgi:hypothetical protein